MGLSFKTAKTIKTVIIWILLIAIVISISLTIYAIRLGNRSIAEKQSMVYGSGETDENNLEIIRDIEKYYEGFEESVETFQSVEKRQKWTDCKTWAEVFSNKKLLEDYLKDRDDMLLDLDVDWSDVYKKIDMTKNKQIFAIINREKSDDVDKMIVSKIIQSDDGKNNTPIDVPGLFILRFNPEKDAFPGSVDLFAAITNEMNRHYAGTILLSNYGINIIHMNSKVRDLLDASYKSHTINIYNYIFDVLSSYGSTRSWRQYELSDVIKQIELFGIRFITYPTSTYVNAYYNLYWHGTYTSPHDNVLDYIIKRIAELKNKEKNSKKITQL
jgi:hypothetical protein